MGAWHRKNFTKIATDSIKDAEEFLHAQVSQPFQTLAVSASSPDRVERLAKIQKRIANLDWHFAFQLQLGFLAKLHDEGGQLYAIWRESPDIAGLEWLNQVWAKHSWLPVRHLGLHCELRPLW